MLNNLSINLKTFYEVSKKYLGEINDTSIWNGVTYKTLNSIWVNKNETVMTIGSYYRSFKFNFGTAEDLQSLIYDNYNSNTLIKLMYSPDGLRAFYCFYRGSVGKWYYGQSDVNNPYELPSTTNYVGFINSIQILPYFDFSEDGKTFFFTYYYSPSQLYKLYAVPLSTAWDLNSTGSMVFKNNLGTLYEGWFSYNRIMGDSSNTFLTAPHNFNGLSSLSYSAFGIANLDLGGFKQAHNINNNNNKEFFILDACAPNPNTIYVLAWDENAPYTYNKFVVIKLSNV